MALRDQPYLPLYIQDFMTDERLAECSASSTGVYIRLMCLLHKSEIYGKILLKQKHKQTDNQISNFALMVAKNMPYTFETVRDAIHELVDEKVLEIDGDFLFQKRMVKDGSISEKRSKIGSIGGQKTQNKNRDFASNFALANNEANTENENENENENKDEIKGKGVKGKRDPEIPVAETINPFSDILKDCPNVRKLKNQLTPEQAEKLITDFGFDQTREILLQMENYKGLDRKYQSVHLTALNWLKRANEGKTTNNNNNVKHPNSTQPGKISVADALRRF